MKLCLEFIRFTSKNSYLKVGCFSSVYKGKKYWELYWLWKIGLLSFSTKKEDSKSRSMSLDWTYRWLMSSSNLFLISLTVYVIFFKRQSFNYFVTNYIFSLIRFIFSTHVYLYYKRDWIAVLVYSSKFLWYFNFFRKWELFFSNSTVIFSCSLIFFLRCMKWKFFWFPRVKN
jgi:hypothetical protein